MEFSVQFRFWNVSLTLNNNAGKSEKDYATTFMDWREVKVVGGKGGDGRVSFLSVYMIEFAGSLYIEIKWLHFAT